MTELEKYITCEVGDDGSMVFTNLSPIVKEILNELASIHGLFPEEVGERIFLEGLALAYDEAKRKGEVEIIRRELPSKKEKPITVFGKKS